MSGLQCLAADNIWFDKQRFDDAERRFYEGVNGPATPQQQQVKEKSKLFYSSIFLNSSLLVVYLRDFS